MVTFEHIQQAATRIEAYIHRTPVMTSTALNERAGCELYFKCENFQKVGAFKARGAHNAVLRLTQAQREAGVATHSSGNHAAALALAASRTDAPAYIVMPENAPSNKIEAVRGYGAQITFCEPTFEARESGLAAVVERTGATFIAPYDNPDVIAGQGTAVAEMAGQLASSADCLVVPVGGGGLLAGSALSARSLWPDCRVIGAEPAGADDARRSFESGVRQPQPAPDTIADGLRSSLGELNFRLIMEHVDDIFSVADAEILAAMKLVWSRMKIVIEPSAAVALAVVLSRPSEFKGKRVAIVLSGGNVDFPLA